MQQMQGEWENQMKILIIEDNNEISEMLATILAADYTVQQAYSGTEGLLLFQQDAFDLILLDRMLPGKDGDSPNLHGPRHYLDCLR